MQNKKLVFGSLVGLIIVFLAIIVSYKNTQTKNEEKLVIYIALILY